MRNRTIIICSMLLLVNACGSSRSLPASQTASTPMTKPVATPISPMQSLRLQAERGNVDAQFALAQAYDRGRDVPQDKAEAVKWYRRAAEQGDAPSQYYVGNSYWEGIGVTKKEQEAVRWWQLAAAQGFGLAQNSLGRALVTGGSGVSPDKIQAYVWLTLSANQGNQEADQQRAVLSKQLKPDQIEKGKRLIKEWKPTKPRAVVSRSSP